MQAVSRHNPTPLQRLEAAGRATANAARDLVAPMRIDDRYAKVAPAHPTGLKIVSYNVCNEDWKPEQIERDLANTDADVICLQETNLAITQRLAKRLGMHYAFYAQRSPIKGSLKAVLSRYPIVGATDRPYGLFWDRLRGYWKHFKQTHQLFSHGETLESRSALVATLDVGGRKVDVLDTHLTLGDSASNAKELRQLAALARARAARGHTVVVGGDFNSNMALALPGAADAPGTLATPTDTPAEFHDRYGAGAGNIEDPADRAAAGDLFTTLQGYWTAPQRTVLQNGQAVSPDAALAQLKSGTVAPGSPRYQQLLHAFDGVTHTGARKRFDNLLASRDVELVSATIDQDATASDHDPVSMEIRFKR